jgi:type IV secretory pathway VirB2 component (pilin)
MAMQKNISKRLRFLFGSLMFLLPSLVFAQGETPVSEGLKYITDAMYGTTGAAIATISVMVVGLLCLGHVLRWSALGYTIIGVSIIFGAGSIVSGVTSLIQH